MAHVLLFSNVQSLPLLSRGKVRDIYDLGDKLLIVTTDRLSAFDIVFSRGIPDKGRVLNLLSAYWFERTKAIVPNHLLSISAKDLPPEALSVAHDLKGRFMIVRKANMFPVECIVRGHLAGSGFKEYKATGQICGIRLPEGLKEGERLEEPIFTPSTKASSGHDVNITFDDLVNLLGREVAIRLKELSIALYKFAYEHALKRGIIIADTKFEFGLLDGEIILCDEVLTPDSSRFWPAQDFEPGRPQPSFDKQYVRDYLEAIGWNKEPPPPDLPDEVVQNTAARYREAFERITGRPLPDYEVEL